MLDHIKRKIVRTAERPDRKAEQDGQLPRWKQEQRRADGHQPEQDKEAPLEPEEPRVLDVAEHGNPASVNFDSCNISAASLTIPFYFAASSIVSRTN